MFDDISKKQKIVTFPTRRESDNRGDRLRQNTRSTPPSYRPSAASRQSSPANRPNASERVVLHPSYVSNDRSRDRAIRRFRKPKNRDRAPAGQTGAGEYLFSNTTDIRPK